MILYYTTLNHVHQYIFEGDFTKEEIPSTSEELFMLDYDSLSRVQQQQHVFNPQFVLNQPAPVTESTHLSRNKSGSIRIVNPETGKDVTFEAVKPKEKLSSKRDSYDKNQKSDANAKFAAMVSFSFSAQESS